MGQVSGDRATEELVHAGPQAAAPAADDDHFGLQDLGESAERVGDIAGKFTKLHRYALLTSYGSDSMGQTAVEDSDIPIRLVGVDGSRLHGSVGMFGNDVAAGLDVGAHQDSLELTGEAGSLPQHRKRLLWCHAHHDVAVCAVF